MNIYFMLNSEKVGLLSTWGMRISFSCSWFKFKFKTFNRIPKRLRFIIASTSDWGDRKFYSTDHRCSYHYHPIASASLARPSSTAWYPNQYTLWHVWSNPGEVIFILIKNWGAKILYVFSGCIASSPSELLTCCLQPYSQLCVTCCLLPTMILLAMSCAQ